MDPLTQGLLGATLALSFSKKKDIKTAAICGALGGMAPDLDVLIRSNADPLLYIEYHRHFTHSLAFIPFGGLIVSMVLWLTFFRKHEFKKIFIYTTLGFATHALLDAATSYGTRLLWPFDNLRVSWNIISIIDPIYTGTLALFVALTIWRKSPLFMWIGFGLSFIYLIFCFNQKLKVSDFIHEIASSRGHQIERLLLNPTIGNSILWRSVYEFDGNYYIDAVRITPFEDDQIFEGLITAVIDKDNVFPSIPADSVQRDDIERFSYFSQDYIYIHPDNPNIIADLRYGSLPYDDKSMWGIEVNPATPNQHVKWRSLREIKEGDLEKFKSLLFHGE